MTTAVAKGARDVRIARVETPEPGPGEIRVRIRACGVCGSDLSCYAFGIYAPGVAPGHEMAGDVDALGKGVAGFSQGDAVVIEPLRTCGTCRWCRSGRDSICPEAQIHGVQLPGGFAEYVCVAAGRVFRAPAEIDARVAALAEPAAVCLHGYDKGRFAPGMRVLVLGAGSVGLMSLVAGRHLGAGELWISARHQHQAELCRKLGADRVLAESEATPEALAGLANAERPDLVIETVGGQANTLHAAVEALAPGGTVSVLGLFMGVPEVNTYTLFRKEATLVFSNCYYHRQDDADFERAVKLLDACREPLAHLTTHSVPLTEIDRAYALAADKRAGVVKVSVVP